MSLTPRGLYQNPCFSIAERTLHIEKKAENNYKMPYLGLLKRWIRIWT